MPEIRQDGACQGRSRVNEAIAAFDKDHSVQILFKGQNGAPGSIICRWLNRPATWLSHSGRMALFDRAACSKVAIFTPHKYHSFFTSFCISSDSFSNIISSFPIICFERNHYDFSLVKHSLYIRNCLHLPLIFPDQSSMLHIIPIPIFFSYSILMFKKHGLIKTISHVAAIRHSFFTNLVTSLYEFFHFLIHDKHL